MPVSADSVVLEGNALTKSHINEGAEVIVVSAVHSLRISGLNITLTSSLVFMEEVSNFLDLYGSAFIAESALNFTWSEAVFGTSSFVRVTEGVRMSYTDILAY